MFTFISGVVAMHIETLEAVQREAKRLPPIQKVCLSFIFTFSWPCLTWKYVDIFQNIPIKYLEQKIYSWLLVFFGQIASAASAYVLKILICMSCVLLSFNFLIVATISRKL